MERIHFFFCFKCANKNRKGYWILKRWAAGTVPAGGVYSSSVTSQASRAATELVPTAALVMASPIVNCSSICLACMEGNKSRKTARTFPKDVYLHTKAVWYQPCQRALFLRFLLDCSHLTWWLTGEGWGGERTENVENDLYTTLHSSPSAENH